MDILHRRGRATVAEVMADLSGEPAYSTVRAQLRVLEEKGHIRHEEEQLRYVYLPAQSHRVASRSALKHVLDTFFQGSPEQIVEAMLGRDGSGVSREELDRIADLIERARRDKQAQVIKATIVLLDRLRGDPAAAPPFGGGTARAVARRHRHRCGASPAHVAAAVVGALLGAASSRHVAGRVRDPIGSGQCR